MQSDREIREKSFQLFFSGANENRKIQQSIKNKENSKSPYIRKVNALNINQNRKRWGTPSTPNMLKETFLNFQTPKISPRRLSMDFNFCSESNDVNPDDLIKRFRALSKNKQRLLIEKLEELEKINEGV